MIRDKLESYFKTIGSYQMNMINGIKKLSLLKKVKNLENIIIFKRGG